MGESPLIPQERVFYQDFLDWLNEQDNEVGSKVGKVDNAHANSSRWSVNVVERFAVGHTEEMLTGATVQRSR